MKGLPLILVTMVFIGVFANSVISLQINEVRANWDKRRCEALVIAVAHLIPDGKDPTIDPSQFSIDNFAFCLKSVVTSSLNAALYPVTQAFKLQVDLTQPIAESTNYLRANAKSLMNPLNSYFQSLWDRMKIITSKISQIFYKLNSAYQRVQGILTSTLFAGISIIRGILNVLNVVIWVIRLIIIILAIILAIVLTVAIFIPSYFAYAAALSVAIAVATASVAASIAAVGEGFEDGERYTVRG